MNLFTSWENETAILKKGDGRMTAAFLLRLWANSVKMKPI